MNKRFSIILIVLLSVISSSCCHQTKKDILAVSFPEAPVEIMSNTSAGMDLINYFNILQLPQGGYRMYFSGYKADECGPDWDNQNLYYAESTDGIHYEPCGKVMDSIIEQTVFLTGDREKPFGLVGRVRENKKFAMYMWKSKDGLEFGDKTLLLNGWHDTQCFMVPRNGRFKLYTRTWDDDHRNRKNAVVEFSPEGERLSEISPLPGDFLYNSAACPVDERLDILFIVDPGYPVFEIFLSKKPEIYSITDDHICFIKSRQRLLCHHRPLTRPHAYYCNSCHKHLCFCISISFFRQLRQ